MKQEWTLQRIDSLLSAQASSGLTKKAFFKSKGIKPATFYYWQKKLCGEPRGFVEVVPPAASYTHIEVHVDGLGWVRLRSRDAHSLATAVMALKAAADA